MTTTIHLATPQDLMEILLDAPDFWRLVEDRLDTGIRHHIRTQAKITGTINVTVELPITDGPTDRELDLKENAIKGTV